MVHRADFSVIHTEFVEGQIVEFGVEQGHLCGRFQKDGWYQEVQLSGLPLWIENEAELRTTIEHIRRSALSFSYYYGGWKITFKATHNGVLLDEERSKHVREIRSLKSDDVGFFTRDCPYVQKLEGSDLEIEELGIVFPTMQKLAFFGPLPQPLCTHRFLHICGRTIGSTLYEICLPAHDIGDLGCHALAPLMNGPLRKLYLRNNQITDLGIRYLKLPETLDTFSISGNQIMDRGIEALCSRTKSITDLGISYNQVTGQGLLTLVQRIKIYSLSIEGNKISPMCATVLANALISTKVTELRADKALLEPIGRVILKTRIIELNLGWERKYAKELKYQRGQIWFMDPKPTKGSEMGKKRRPCVILSRLEAQVPKKLTVALCTTTKRDRHVCINRGSRGLLEEVTYVSIEDIRSIDKKRLVEKEPRDHVKPEDLAILDQLVENHVL